MYLSSGVCTLSSSSIDRIHVFARIRPLNRIEIRNGNKTVTSVLGNKLAIETNLIKRNFTFDRIFDVNTSQDDVSKILKSFCLYF